MSSDSNCGGAPRKCRQFGCLRRGFYILTEHATGVRQRPSMEAAVIGMLYSVSVPSSAEAQDPTDQAPHEQTRPLAPPAYR
jgi:hypothetical protein